MPGHCLPSAPEVKHENHTPTAAFEVRGGIVYMDHLKRSQAKVTGVISATRGNHGQSIAFSASRAGIPATIYVPHGNSSDQNAAMRAFGAAVPSRITHFLHVLANLTTATS